MNNSFSCGKFKGVNQTNCSFIEEKNNKIQWKRRKKKIFESEIGTGTYRLSNCFYSSQIFFHAKIELKNIKYIKLDNVLIKNKIRKQAYLFLDFKLSRRHQVWSHGSQTMDRTKTLSLIMTKRRQNKEKNTAKKKFHRR